MIGHVAELLDDRAAALDAEHAVFVERRIALAGKDVLAVVFLDRLLEEFLGLVAGGGHQRVVVVERDHRQDDVAGERIAGTDKGLGAAGALEAVQPDHRRPRLGLQCVRDLAGEFRAEPRPAAVRLQNFRKLRRVMPCWRMTS